MFLEDHEFIQYYVMQAIPNISSSAIDVTPTYENNTSTLTKLTTEFNTTVSLQCMVLLLQRYDMIFFCMQENMRYTTTLDSHDVDMINSSVISYTVNYTDVNTGRSCGNGTLSANSCTNGVCSHEFRVNSSMCPPETNYNIKMYGTNALGDGKILIQ